MAHRFNYNDNFGLIQEGLTCADVLGTFQTHIPPLIMTHWAWGGGSILGSNSKRYSLGELSQPIFPDYQARKLEYIQSYRLNTKYGSNSVKTSYSLLSQQEKI